MDYVLFGIQGAGKGTQGKLLAERIHAAYFETGGELRRLAHEESELGKKVKSIIESGRLVPNEVVMEIAENFIKNVAQWPTTIIFDGIPRNAEQSETFEALLKKMGRVYLGIYFEIGREEAETRLIKRRICTKCKTVYPAFYEKSLCEKCNGQLVTRSDDNAEAIRTRIKIFYSETLPVIESWAAREAIIKVNGVGSIEEVSARLTSALGSLGQ